MNPLRFDIMADDRSAAAFRSVQSNLTRTERMFRAVEARARAVSQTLGRISARLSVSVTAPIVGFGALTLKAAGDFEQAMNRVAAAADGISAGELAALEEQARALGGSTRFSAREAAGAMEFLARAGFDVEEVIGAMPSTLQLAAAANLDLATSADIVSNVLSGYGQTTDDLAGTVDVLVKAMTSANTDLRQLGDAMKYVAPVAASAGVDFEEAAAAIGLMSDAGIQGEMAGNALKGAISRIVNPTAAFTKAANEAGLAFTDAEGRLLPLVDIVAALEPHADDAGLMMALFGQRAGPAMAALVAQGGDAVARLTGELEGAGGTAERVAARQMEGFNGAVLELRSAFQELQIAIGEAGFLDLATELTRGLTELARAAGELDPAVLRLGTAFAAAAAAIPVVIGGLALLAGAIGVVGAPVAAATAAILALAAGYVAFREEANAAIGAAVEWTRERLAALATFVDGVAERIVAAARRIYEGVRTWLLDRFREVVEGVRGALESVVGFFEDAWARIVGRSIVPDMVDGVLAEFARMARGMPEKTREGVEATSAELDRFGGLFSGTLTDLFRFGETSAESFGDRVVSILSRMADRVLAEALRPLEEALSQTFAGLLGGGSGGGGGLGGLLQGIGDWFAGAFAGGGTIPTGSFGLVGEAGPELVRAGAGGAEVVPLAAGRGAPAPVSVTVNIATPDVEGFRRSQAQVTAALARAVQRGQRGL